MHDIKVLKKHIDDFVKKLKDRNIKLDKKYILDLDLKNIRSVLIMEPYWNEVRIKQVIGRAVRRGSHLNLPKKDQNVSIYRFITKFTESQIKNSQLYSIYFK